MKKESIPKNVPEIINRLKTQAEKGSCKECQFCRPERNDEYGTTHVCEIQMSTWITRFKKTEIRRKGYPLGPCEAGSWIWGDDNVKPERIAVCLAYKPRLTDNQQQEDEAIKKQIKFIRTLVAAAHLHTAAKLINEGKLDELMRELADNS